MTMSSNPGPSSPAPSASPPASIDVIAAALAEQVALAEQLAELSLEQSSAVAEGRVDDAYAILQRRQPIVQSMGRLSARIEPIAGRLLEAFPELEEPRRSQLLEAVTRLEGLISEVNQRDAEDRRTLERCREAVGAELAGLGKGRNMVGAYGGGPVSNAAAFQDREG